MATALEIAVAQANLKLDTLLERFPAPGQPPPEPTPKPSSADIFKAKYKKLTPAEFEAKYGVPYGASLPPLSTPPPPDKVIEYAAQWYSWQGFLRGPLPVEPPETQESVAAQVIDDNANERPTFYTGIGIGSGPYLCDSDIAVVFYLTGMGPSLGYCRAHMGGPTLQPYLNPERWDFPRFCASLPGGQPSGG